MELLTEPQSCKIKTLLIYTGIGSLLIPIIMSEFPSEIRLRIARETMEEVWKMEDFLEVIWTEIEAREASESVRVNSTRHSLLVQRLSHNPSATASSLFSSSGGIQCIYCGKDHYSASCSKVTSASERKDILLKMFYYLMFYFKTSYKSCDCSSSKGCHLCHHRHHQSICVVHVEDSVPSADTNSVTNTANSLKGKCTILFQTAQAIATNESAKTSQWVRVLFDSGSQHSYMTLRGLCLSIKMEVMWMSWRCMCAYLLVPLPEPYILN